MASLILVALTAPFALAVLMPVLGRKLGQRTGLFALFAPLASAAAIIAMLNQPVADRLPVSWEWVPALGASLTFNPDGLALFYGLVVAGIGTLVIAYASSYLDNHYRDHGKFYCYLLLFMGSMLATVFSSNLLVLFIAWELTGLTSFLLIGFLHDKETSQRGARMALLTTGLTGLALLAGIVLLRIAYGTFELSEILARIAPGGVGVMTGRESLLGPAFLCCFLGIAGKSAQFPFHYWLPNAMAAPTPVSAYLHSATMVKLGVFLVARLLPVFNDLPAWTPLIVVVGFGTLVLGAVLSLLSQDLKGVLAYSTVAQLGLLIGFYGLHPAGMPVAWDYVHILNHVFYKACLFMVVGIIDHSTGTRDLRELGGLARKMPITAAAAAVSLAALAGLPFTTGFLSKEMLLSTVLSFWERADSPALAAWVLACVFVASVIKVAIALGVWFRAFAGTSTPKLEAHFHPPSFWLQLPPLLLAVAVLVYGVAAGHFGAITGLFAVPAVHAASPGELHLWHGFTFALGLSLLIILLGSALYFIVGKGAWSRLSIPGYLQFDGGFDRLLEAVQLGGKKLNRVLGFDTPYAHLFIIATVMLATVLSFLIPHVREIGLLAAGWSLWPKDFGGWELWVIVALAGGGALAAAFWKTPLKQVIALSVTGFSLTVYYVLYSAPDLALTQLLVETATLLLVLFVVLRFKRDNADREPLSPMPMLPRAARIALAALFGLMLGGGVLLFQSPPSTESATGPVGTWYLAQTMPLAKGQNAVNTIVVDFRGWDTFLEISVLVIAALGCLGLLHRARTTVSRQTNHSSSQAGGLHRTLPSETPAQAGGSDLFPVPRDLILRAVALCLFVPLNLFALYLFLRGHNAPGGGFIAGLVSAISLLLLTFAVGVHGVRRLLRFNPISLAIAGVSLAVATAVLPVLFGMPLFSQFHAYLPGGFYVGGPFWFDMGVYLTVLGSVLKLIMPLMKSVHRLPAFVSEEAGRFSEELSDPIDLPGKKGTPEQ